MGSETSAIEQGSAWNPGVGPGIPREFRELETIFRPECAFGGFGEIDELAALTGLPAEELAAFRPQRLALHEIIVRVTADIAVAEGEEEEDFGRNFRRIASKIHDDYVWPHMDEIESVWTDLGRRTNALVRELLTESLFAAPPPVAQRSWFGRWPTRKSTPPLARSRPPSATTGSSRRTRPWAWPRRIPCGAPCARAFTAYSARLPVDAAASARIRICW